MQHAAQTAFDTQTLFALLTGTLPCSVPRASVDEGAIRRRLGAGMASAATMKATFEDKNIPYPIPTAGPGIVTVFLLDMDGTLSSMPFARSVVFPQMLSHIESYMMTHYPGDGRLDACVKAACGKSAELAAAVAAARESSFSDPALTSAARSLLCAHMTHATETQSVMPYVKQFQGDVWSEYVEQQGDNANTKVFNDFVDFAKARGSRLAQSVSQLFIYSSGSVESQKTVLTHTQAGDLTPFVTGFIDLSKVGSKIIPSSYNKIRAHIAGVMGLSRDGFRIIFCTDSTTEASAADSSDAVDCSILFVRPGNAWINIDTFLAVSAPHIVSFAQLMGAPQPVDYDALVAEVTEFLPAARSASQS